MDLAAAVPGGGLERRIPLVFPAASLNSLKAVGCPARQGNARAHNSADQKLKRLCRDGKVREAIAVLEERGSTVSTKTFIALLQSCIDSKSLEDGRRLHGKIGLVRNPSSFVETKLVSMYAKCGQLDEAFKVFAEMRERNLFAWSAMINGYAREKKWDRVISMFFEMYDEGILPDAFLFPKFLQACANLGDLETGKLLHSFAVRTGLVELAVEAHVSNSVLAMYAKCGDLASAKKFFGKMETRDRVSWNSLISGHCQRGELDDAHLLFDKMLRTEGIQPGLVTWNILITSYNQMGKPDAAMELMKKMRDHSSGELIPDVVTWTSMISGFAQNNRPEQALQLFLQMEQACVDPNHVTFASAISACAALKNSCTGAQLHAATAKAGLSRLQLVGNALTDMYAKCGQLEDARRAFDSTSDRDVFTWNSLIGGYAQAGYCGQAYDLFSRMESSGVRRNVVTWNVMISGYLQSGDVDQAAELFRSMEESGGVEPSTSSWNLLISGSILNSQKDSALRIFRQMQSLGWKPNHITLLSVVPACANILSLHKLKELHCCALRAGLLPEFTSLSNSLIDAYMKCGDARSAERVFEGMPDRGDVLSWNSLMDGYLLHGRHDSAIQFFQRMLSAEEAKPDRATFVGVLNAYALAGKVKEGKELFDAMREEFSGSELCAAMVHLFGRAGMLSKAEDFIGSMAMEPDAKVWAALLIAARAHGLAASVELALENLTRLKPKNPVFRRLSLQLRGGSAEKSKKATNNDAAGCCWVAVKNKVHAVASGDASVLAAEAVQNMLDRLDAETREWSSAERTKLAMEDEEREEVAGIRSEKLALSLALVKGLPEGEIRIVKNMRVSGGGHAAAKAASRLFRRKVLIKDPGVLHCFQDGECSCGDYW